MTWTGTVTSVTLCVVDREMTKKFALCWAAHVTAVTELKKQIHTGGEDLGQAESTAILGPAEADRRTQHFWQYAQERKLRARGRGTATSCLPSQSR